MVLALPDSVAVLRPDLPPALAAEWHTLASAGTWFAGAQRIAIAAEARDAMALPPVSPLSRRAHLPRAHLQAVVQRAARRVAADAAAIDLALIDELVAAGLDHPAVAEVIGVVARLSAVDRLFQALGLPLPPLPAPQSGEPSRQPPRGPQITGQSFLPMIAQVSIPQTLSLVRAESRAWQQLADALYMSFAEMEDLDFRRHLHRRQLELVAARTSLRNDCFY